MKLSIIIPVFNEKLTINEIINHIENAVLPESIKEREIVIVDDYSTDGTRELLKQINKDYIKIFYHEKNQGKGAGLRTGFQKATGDIVIVQDADLEYDPAEYPKLLKPILDNKADVVYGSRFAGGESHRILYFWHMLANQILTLLSNMFSDLNLTDMETGYKVFRKWVIDKIIIEENRFGFEPEVTAKIGELAREEGVRVYEVGISYYGRTIPEGKKIGLKDAFWALWCIFKYNTSKFAHFVKYGFMGVLVTLSQLITIIFFVEKCNFNSVLLKNIAHAISVEVSIIVGFILHSLITWRYKYDSLVNFFINIIKFHLITGLSFIIRQITFYCFTNIGIDYKISTLIGICIAIVINFIGYDFFVFKKLKN